MKIWIDADAAPRDVKEIVFRAARRLNIPAVLVANQHLRPPPGNPLVTAVWVDGGADVADQHIAAEAQPGDLVVTQDVPLAALLVPKGIAVLDPRGDGPLLRHLTACSQDSCARQVREAPVAAFRSRRYPLH